MNIALVGFTNSYNDRQWLDMARAFLARHDPPCAWTDPQPHVFDLRGPHGRNFLDDRGQYDIVILFAIYNPPTGSRRLTKSLGRHVGQTALAANHARETWAERLAKTGARYLFVFRRPDSVTGEWLGEIPCYTKRPDQPGVFGVSIYQHNHHHASTPSPTPDPIQDR